MGDTLPSVRRSRARLAQKIQVGRLSIRVFEDERKTLEQRANAAHKSLSAFVRDTLLSPVIYQSSAIPTPISETEETLFNSNEQEEEQTFVHKSAGEHSSAESFSKQVASAAGERDLASERTGHARGCGCFACERLRAMLASSTTISGSGNARKQTVSKQTRVK